MNAQDIKKLIREGIQELGNSNNEQGTNEDAEAKENEKEKETDTNEVDFTELSDEEKDGLISSLIERVEQLEKDDNKDADATEEDEKND